MSALAEAHLAHANLDRMVVGGRLNMIDWLARIARGTTGYGDSWSHVLLAEGALEVALEPRAVLLDLAPLQVIVEEAGGRFTSIAGLPSVSGPDGLSSNGTPLHNEVLIIPNLESLRTSEVTWSSWLSRGSSRSPRYALQATAIMLWGFALENLVKGASHQAGSGSRDG